MSAIDLARVGRALGAIRVRAWRLHLQTPGVQASVPMLRGVYGAALREIAPAVYDRVFDGGESQSPRYLLRPASRDARPAPAVEFLLFGHPGPEDDAALWAAWDRASAMGLGPERRAFRIASAVPLAWDGTPLRPGRDQPGFTTDRLPWPLDGPDAACRLDFPAPLRLIHQRRLVTQPAPPDLAIAALRRIQALAAPHPDAEALWNDRRDWIDLARSIPAGPWRGRRLDLARYSGSQRSEVVLRGVAGSLPFPSGLGPLTPLLLASEWLHLGKGTVMGLGQVRIVAIDAPA